MNNLYIYFLVNLNLILIVAKIWERISVSWLWVMSPIIAITVIGLLAYIHRMKGQNRMRSDIVNTLAGLQDLVRKAREKEKGTARQGI